MEARKNPKLKKNGGPGTKVGNFLRGIDYRDVTKVIGNLAVGNIAGAVDVITGDTSLSDEEKEFALKIMEQDIAEMESVTYRWEADMSSDSWLSKNVRPLSLVFLTIFTMLLIYIDSFTDAVVVEEEWISLLKTLLLSVFMAYFGSRGVEKWKTIHEK